MHPVEGEADVRPIKQSLQSQFRQAANDKWLRARYEAGDYTGLLEAALALNALCEMEKTKSTWALGEAADTLADHYGLDRDSA